MMTRTSAMRSAFFCIGLTLVCTACTTYKGYMGTACGWEEATLFPQGVIIRRSNGVEIPPEAKRVMVKYGENELWVSTGAPDDEELDSRPAYKLIFIARAEQRYAITQRGGDGLICVWETLPMSEEPDFTRSYGCATE